jgi:hypothetical protein
MTNLDNDFFAEYRVRNAEPSAWPAAQYRYVERPGGVTAVAVILTLAILANIVMSLVAIGNLSNDEYYYSQSTIDAAKGVLWVNILLTLPVFGFIAGLFGEGDWARVGLISYLCCNSAFVAISLFISPSYLWVSLLLDIAIIAYLARDDVASAYPNESGKGWGTASGIGLVVAQVIAIVLVLHAAS